MVRLQIALFAVGVLCLSAATADDKPKPALEAKVAADDDIAAALKTAKEDYKSAVEKAGEKLLADFTDRQKKLADDTKLKVDQVIKLVEQVQVEKKAFELDPAKLPKSAGMNVAASDYQTKTAAARKKCEAAFDEAAEAYRGKRDLVIAKAVLAEKKQFFAAAGAAADPRRVWMGSRGVLMHVKDDVWRHLPNAGGEYVFKEVSRNEKYIEIVDMTRGAKGVYFRIEADRLFTKWPDKDRDWRVLSEGSWEKAK